MRSLAVTLALGATLYAEPVLAAPNAVWQWAAAPQSTTAINQYSQEEFDVWWGFLDEAQTAIDAKQNWVYIQGKVAHAADYLKREDKLRHYTQHSEFEAGKTRLRDLIAGMYGLQIEQVAAAMPDALNKAKAAANVAMCQKLQEQADGLARTLGFYKESRGASDPQVPKLTALVAETQRQVSTIGGLVRMAAAAKIAFPAEKYGGADKGKLKQMVMAKWKEARPQDQVLGVRFYEANWIRKKETTLNNGTFYHYDNSILQGYVVTKNTADLASFYPIYVRKDNASGNIKIDVQTQNPSDVLVKNLRF
jgi:hypothetical protein